MFVTCFSSPFADVLRVFLIGGFSQTVLIFSVAETTVNAIATFLNPLLMPLGFHHHFVGFLGQSKVEVAVRGSFSFSVFLCFRCSVYRLCLDWFLDNGVGR